MQIMQIMQEFIVSNLEDENDGDFSDGDLSLREAIAIAKSGDTISFSTDLNGSTIDLSLGELLVDKNLTINGSNTERLTIDAGGASRVFNLDDGNAETNLDITLEGLNITGGDVSLAFESSSFGGGISSQENLKLVNSSVSGNAAGQAGGGIYSAGERLTIANSTIDDNSALRPVAVSTTKGGGIAIEGTTVEITGSTISNNEASLGGGGIDAQNSDLTITDTKIEDNFGQFAGGINSTSSTVNLTSSEIRNNRTGIFQGSGAINSDAESVLRVDRSTIDGNSGIDPFNPSPPRGSQAFASGIGARGTTTISNSTVSNNTVQRIDSPADDDLNTNSDVGYGIRNTGTLEVSNSTFAANIDAGINNDGGSVKIANTTIADRAIGIDLAAEDATVTSSIVVDDTQELEAAIDRNQNLVGNSENLNLGELQDNGGATATIALSSGSLAIDAGSNPNNLATDQRGTGFARTVGEGTDSGAFELQDVDGQQPRQPEVEVPEIEVPNIDPPEIEVPNIETPEIEVPNPSTLLAGTDDNDHLSGSGTSDEVISGGAGDDTLDGNGGNDHILGGTGNDVIFGGAGHDTLDGTTGHNHISGEHGDDVLFGGENNDTLIGGADNDLLVGAAGHDSLIGSDGHDVINGELGNDFINGDAGDDLLTGGAGADTLLGGAGHDVFVLESCELHDVIVDFELGSDRLQLSESLNFGQLTIVDNESNTGALILDRTNNDALIASVENVRAEDLNIHVFS